MGYLLTCFCFEPDTLTPEDIGQLIRRGVGFDPREVTIKNGGRRRSRYSESILTKIESSSRLSEVYLQTENGLGGSYFQVMPIGTWSFQAVYWRAESLDVPSSATCDWLSSLEGFNAGYRCAAEDVFWQSEANTSTYDLYHRPHHHLPKVGDPAFGGVKIDIIQNPGRRTPYPGMWLQSSWQMWFGRGAFRRIPASRLRDFRGAMVNRSLDSGAIFIQLYQDPFAYDAPEHRALQAAFREWSGMNELESRSAVDGTRASDPTFEIHEGTFPHGGVRLLTEWRDQRGAPTRRSQATQRMDVELDPNGQEVWRQTLTL